MGRNFHRALVRSSVQGRLQIMTDSSISGWAALQRTPGSHIPSSSHQVIANMFILCEFGRSSGPLGDSRRAASRRGANERKKADVWSGGQKKTKNKGTLAVARKDSLAPTKIWEMCLRAAGVDPTIFFYFISFGQTKKSTTKGAAENYRSKLLVVDEWKKFLFFFVFFQKPIRVCRSIMTDLYYLSQADGVGEWRVKEAKDLSDLVQNRITYLQVCTDTRAAGVSGGWWPRFSAQLWNFIFQKKKKTSLGNYGKCEVVLCKNVQVCRRWQTATCSYSENMILGKNKRRRKRKKNFMEMCSSLYKQ